MKLTIVIPALNEEDAIGATIERTLAARAHIVQNAPVDQVEIIVVSDGSTDRTAEIAAGFSEVRLIIFEHNRGYGAAIKAGFDASTGELVSFLDADGTCDPRFFADLSHALVETNAAVALGSRLGPTSHMPPIRRLGNRVYAFILSVLSNRVVTDTASGMRVIRRDALEQLYPLPDGLHFTPAMSARVLMDDALTVVERPMHYEERIGESKLHVVRDGLRFFRTIFEMTLMWQPGRLFVACGMMCVALMALLATFPIETWIRAGRLNEDMIYRLLACSLLGTMGVALVSSGVVCDNLRRMWDMHCTPRTYFASRLDRLYSWPGFLTALIPAVPLLACLVGPGVWTRITSGYVALHWSRVVLAGLIVATLGQWLLTTLVVNLIRFHTARESLAERRNTIYAANATANDLVRSKITPTPRRTDTDVLASTT